MRTPSAAVIIAALLFAAILEDAVLLGIARHLFFDRTPAEGASRGDVRLAPSTVVREAEAAERWACRGFVQLDLFGPRMRCEAR